MTGRGPRMGASGVAPLLAPAALLVLFLGGCQTTERPLSGPMQVRGWADGSADSGGIGLPGGLDPRSGDASGSPLEAYLAPPTGGDPGGLYSGTLSGDRTSPPAPTDGTQAPGGQQPQDPEIARRQQEASLRARFGSSVVIGADGRVTKLYQMMGEVGAVFQKLCVKPGGAFATDGKSVAVLGGPEASSILGRMLGGATVEVVYNAEFSRVPSVELREPRAGKILPITIAPDFNKGTLIDLAQVTAEASALERFEDALNLFYGRMPQVEIKVEVVEFTRNDALNFGVQQVGAAPLLQNQSSNQLVRSFTSEFPLRSPLVGGNPITDLGVFTLGGIHDSWELNAQLEVLEANSNAEITSSPTLVVRNGGVATIETITDFPFPRAQITTNGNQVSADIQFKPVGVTMKILPIIAGTDTIILQLAADVSAVTGFADTEPVDTPIIANRSATTIVQLRNQQSLVIGGLKSRSTFESESKVPLLGDIPLLGFLFRSTSIQNNDTEVSFIITPTIKMGIEDL